jgi:hypothetical protein
VKPNLPSHGRGREGQEADALGADGEDWAARKNIQHKRQRQPGNDRPDQHRENADRPHRKDEAEADEGGAQQKHG